MGNLCLHWSQARRLLVDLWSGAGSNRRPSAFQWGSLRPGNLGGWAERLGLQPRHRTAANADVPPRPPRAARSLSQPVGDRQLVNDRSGGSCPRLVRNWSANARRSLDRARPSRTGRTSCDHDCARRPGTVLISATRLLTMAPGVGPFSRPPPSATRRTLPIPRPASHTPRPLKASQIRARNPRSATVRPWRECRPRAAGQADKGRVQDRDPREGRMG
jgi:hypothetical protein